MDFAIEITPIRFYPHKNDTLIELMDVRLWLNRRLKTLTLIHFYNGRMFYGVGDKIIMLRILGFNIIKYRTTTRKQIPAN